MRLMSYVRTTIRVVTAAAMMIAPTTVGMMIFNAEPPEVGAAQNDF